MEDETKPGVVGDYDLVYNEADAVLPGNTVQNDLIPGAEVLDTRLSETYTQEEAVNDIQRARSDALEDQILFSQRGRRNFPTATETGFYKDTRESMGDVAAMEMETLKSFLVPEYGAVKHIDPSRDAKRPVPDEYDPDLLLRPENRNNLLRLMFMSHMVK